MCNTIKEALKKGYSVRRLCTYYALDEKGRIMYHIRGESHYEFLWRKAPKKRKKKK
jgi:hypothetical protein